MKKMNAKLRAILKAQGVTDVLVSENNLTCFVAVIPGATLLKLIPAERVGKLMVQRNDKARLETGKAAHIKKRGELRPDTQQEFSLAWFEGKLWAMNGNHRIRYWHQDPSATMQSVIVHIYDTPTLKDVVQLYDTIDARTNVKGRQDSLWSIFNLAGFADSLVSAKMKTGATLVTVMNHFLPGASLQERATEATLKQRSLLLADHILDRLPVRGNVRSVKEVFGASELLAILRLAHKYDTRPGLAFTQFYAELEDHLLPYVTYAIRGSRDPKVPVMADVFEAYEEAAIEEGLARTGEKPVPARAAILEGLLEKYMDDKFSATRAKRKTGTR